MSSDYRILEDSKVHFRSLGSLWIVYGVVRLIMVLCLLVYGRTATLMFGALLSRVPDPFAYLDIFHLLYTVEIALSAVCGLIGLVAGLALLGGHSSGRRLALISAVLSVSDIPLGITLGIYTLVDLLPSKIMPLYGRAGDAD
jgi:hypothetical protein